MADRYERAWWGPGYVIKYVDTGIVYNGAPVFAIAIGNSDTVESPGLLAVYESDSYRVAEIERHIHSYERWFGSGGQTLTPFTIDSGNNTWGAWVQILTAANTPVTVGNAYYDLHRLLVTTAERNTPYRVQLGFGASGAAALTAGEYTEVMYAPNVGLIDAAPVEVQGRRHAAGTPAWARCWNAADTGTLTFYVGLHEYEG